MNILIDFSQDSYLKATDLYALGQINQITLIIPLFVFIQANFNQILQYVVYLKQNPLVKGKIKSIVSQQEKKKLQKFDIISVRGTFDRLHIGHQLLLLNAIYSAKQQLVIQIKGDLLTQNKKLKQLVQPYQVRKKAIQQFVQTVKPQLKVKIIQIQQIYGIVPNSKSINAIVVSEESTFSAKHINKLRKQNGLKKVQIIITPVVTSANQTKQLRVQNKISSKNLRQAILSANNFTIQQYSTYKNIWNLLIKQINTLCNVKDPQFLKSEQWFQKVLNFHLANKSYSNKQILQNIIKLSSPQHQSLSQIAQNLKLFLRGVKTQKQNQLKGVCKQFLESVLKKKSKICKQVKKMILKQIEQNLKQQKKKKQQQKNEKGNKSEINKTEYSKDSSQNNIQDNNFQTQTVENFTFNEEQL